MSRLRDMVAVQQVLITHEMVARAKINVRKNKGLWLGTWRDGILLPELSRWSDGSICILRIWFGSDLQLKRNWSEVQPKAEAQVSNWLRRRLSLKDRVEVCAVYIFTPILYRLSTLTLSASWRLVLERSEQSISLIVLVSTADSCAEET